MTKDINSAPKFMLYALTEAVRHPRKKIRYKYCPDCRVRIRPDQNECPVCEKRVRGNPEEREMSPVPWYGSLAVIALGIVSWILGVLIPVPEMTEAGRALVYIPLGNLFGMSLKD